MAATVKDIAKKTGLGLATISKYLNGGNVREKNKIAIEEAIKELNFTVNEFARSLKTSESKIVGIIIPDLSNTFITTIISTIEDILRKEGYGTIICDSRENAQIEEENVKFLISKMVDGIIIMPVNVDDLFLTPAISKHIPVVLIDRIISSEKNEFNAVVVNNYLASYEATELLIKNGHKEIGIIAGPKGVFTSQQRLSGYVGAFINNNIDLPKECIKFSDYTVQGGYECVKRLIKEKKDLSAVFVTNYEMTLGAIIAINELGIKIPSDISIIGFDNFALCNVISPPITIVTQPLYEMGKNAAEIILKKMKDKSFSNGITVTLKTSIKNGKSIENIAKE